MKTDMELKQDVSDELDWEPSVNAAQIGVAVKEGVVTLTGHVPSYAEKYTAEGTAKRVYGVQAVADELDVKLPGSAVRTDEDVAAAMPATLLHADDVFVPCVKGWGVPDLVVVSPDAGGMKRAQQYAVALGASVAVIAKRRTQPDLALPLQVLGEVGGRSCLIVDDMASTGRTLGGAADALRQAGARDIYGAFTHAVMALGAEDRLLAANFKRLVTSDSIPVSAKPWLNVVSIAPLLAQAIRFLIGEAQLSSPQKDTLCEIPAPPEGEVVFL